MENGKLNIDELSQEVVKIIETVEPEAKVTFNKVLKNNGLTLHGVCIFFKDNGTSIAPTIYIENYMSRYLDGVLTVEQIAADVIDTANEHKDPGIEVDFSSLADFNNAKDLLHIKLINTKANEELLKSVPHTEFLDMSAVYQMAISIKDGESGYAIVHNEMFSKWGISLEELHETALAAMKEHRPAEISQLGDFLLDMVDERDEEAMDFLKRDMEPVMYVVSNKDTRLGASVVLLEETLRSLANIFKGDFYIIPSSIHELIALTANQSGSVEDLREMVKEVNDTQLLQVEVLSYNVYRYSLETGELAIA